MMKIRTRRSKYVLAASLGSLLAVTSLSIQNTGAQQRSGVLTPAQYAQKRDAYLKYRNTLQTQFERQQQAIMQEKLKLVAQRKASEAAAAAAAGKAPKKKHQHVPIRREEVLLVMPQKGAKMKDIKEKIESAQGEICGRLGAGGLNVILVKSRPGKVVELQRALAVDSKDFKHVDFNRPAEADWVPGGEPRYQQAWHLIRMRICDAWDEIEKYNFRFPQCIAVFDSGMQSNEPWITRPGADCTKTVGNSKVDDLGVDIEDDGTATGIDSDDIADSEEDIIEIGNNIKTLTYGCTDTNGHGTYVGSCLNGSPLNKEGAAGVNPQVSVYPIRIADGPRDVKIYTDDLAVVKAMCVMYDCANTRIINISYGGYMAAEWHPVVHEFFKDWYYRKGGLIFVSAGNRGENRSMANQPYVNCVSAMAHKAGMKLVNQKVYKSAFGTAIDFTAPGEDIEVVDPDDNWKTVKGTSFSSPIVAGIASMIWHINGNLKNTEVEKIMRDSCENTDDANSWNPQFGWGMPDAYKCVMAAEGTLPKK